MPRKYSKKQIVKAVTLVRRRNNFLWMILFEEAIKNPKMRKVWREIIRNDKKVVKWMSRI